MLGTVFTICDPTQLYLNQPRNFKNTKNINKTNF